MDRKRQRICLDRKQSSMGNEGQNGRDRLSNSSRQKHTKTSVTSGKAGQWWLSPVIMVGGYTRRGRTRHGALVQPREDVVDRRHVE